MKRTIAHYIAEQLAILGIEKCFMVTGGGAMHLNDAFGKSSLFPVIKLSIHVTLYPCSIRR